MGPRRLARAVPRWLLLLVAVGVASAFARDAPGSRPSAVPPGTDPPRPASEVGPPKPAAGARSALEGFLDRARSLALNFVAVAAVSLVLLAVVEDAWSGSYVIEPIAVPDAFAKSVEGPDAVSARIRDGVGAAWRRALSQYAVKPVVRDAEEPVVNVTGTSLPLRYFVDVLRGLVGRPVTRISGQLTLADAPGGSGPDVRRRVHLTLRRSDGATGPFFVGRDMPYLDAVDAAAIRTLVEVDPFDGARVVSETAPEGGIAIAETALVRAREGGWPAWLERLLPTANEMPRGELALANILLSMGRAHFDEARAHFERANQEFRSRDLRGRDWYAAQDGLATYHVQLADVPDELRSAEGALGYAAEAAHFREVERFARAALALEPGYDSALYHLAQASDLAARSIIRHGRRSASCHAVRLVRRATALYERLVAGHPTFAIAFRDEGVMLLQRLAWITQVKRIGCLRYGADAASTASAKTALRARIAAAFAAAIARDPTLADVPLQWGIMLYEEALDLPEARRLPLLNQAIDQFAKAFPADGTGGKLKDAWAWFRYGETLAATARASPSAAAVQLRARAATAFCKSLDLHPEDDGARKTTSKEFSELGPVKGCGST